MTFTPGKHPRDARGRYRGYDEQRDLYEGMPMRVLFSFHDRATPQLRLAAKGLERLAEAFRDATPSLRRFAWLLSAAAATQRSEAAIRLFHLHPSWSLLWTAMRDAFRASWLEATR